MKFDTENGVKTAVQGFWADIMKEEVRSVVDKWHERIIQLSSATTWKNDISEVFCITANKKVMDAVLFKVSRPSHHGRIVWGC